MEREEEPESSMPVLEAIGMLDVHHISAVYFRGWSFRPTDRGHQIVIGVTCVDGHRHHHHRHHRHRRHHLYQKIVGHRHHHRP